MIDDATLAQWLAEDPDLMSDLTTYMSTHNASIQPLAPSGTTVPSDSMGMFHMTPGTMGQVTETPYTTVDLIVDGGGHFTAFSSSDDSVTSSNRANNEIGQSTASLYLSKAGSTTVNVSWVDQYGNEQSSTIQVTAQ
jgi:hypothetical protein